MPKKSNKPTELNQKNFLKLMEKREKLQKDLNKVKRKLESVNTELGKYSQWLTTLLQS